MSEPFIGEIRMVGFKFAPRGWAFCDGQLLPINQNTALFSILGTTYGGDGKTNFALPDLRGRLPVHASDEIPLGQAGGASSASGNRMLTSLSPERGLPYTSSIVNAATDSSPTLGLYFTIALQGIFPPRP
ncbi:phage tail protein [Alloalcanivorax xenomutans]|uniref:phage tail protein n=1 Tax=Alloalcanivorax xenomutans TaxID=1094342 RepID=UPI0029347093|nr:tail fiber protein [Alloalcanivorax xenomutans]WOD30102.1 tail fiber protein [Alloalcanivorax xenomutans]